MEFFLRKATVADVPTLTTMRIRMFESFAQVDDVEAFRAADETALTEDLQDGRMAAWLAEDKYGTPVATAAVSFYRLPPKPWNRSGECAFISSMFTVPKHRRKGIARQLLGEALNLARATGVGVATLHATPDGKKLYESMGFSDTNEMRMSPVVQLVDEDEDTSVLPGGMQ